MRRTGAATATAPTASCPGSADVVDELAQQIKVNINRAADVNPINLLALWLLSTPKHAMAESDLLATAGAVEKNPARQPCRIPIALP